MMQLNYGKNGSARNHICLRRVKDEKIALIVKKKLLSTWRILNK